ADGLVVGELLHGAPGLADSSRLLGQLGAVLDGLLGLQSSGRAGLLEGLERYRFEPTGALPPYPERFSRAFEAAQFPVIADGLAPVVTQVGAQTDLEGATGDSDFGLVAPALAIDAEEGHVAFDLVGETAAGPHDSQTAIHGLVLDALGRRLVQPVGL